MSEEHYVLTTIMYDSYIVLACFDVCTFRQAEDGCMHRQIT